MKSMMKVTLPWRDGKPSFKLIPIDMNCPFLEARFDLDTKVLRLMSKIKYLSQIMVPKFDDNGEVAYKPGKPIQGREPVIKQERKPNDTFYDYTINDPTDIQKMVDFLVGPTDLREYFVAIEASISPEKQAALDKLNPENDKVAKTADKK